MEIFQTISRQIMSMGSRSVFTRSSTNIFFWTRKPACCSRWMKIEKSAKLISHSFSIKIYMLICDGSWSMNLGLSMKINNKNASVKISYKQLKTVSAEMQPKWQRSDMPIYLNFLPRSKCTAIQSVFRCYFCQGEGE